MMNHCMKTLTATWIYLAIVFIITGSTDGARSDYEPLNRAKRSTQECAEKFRTITTGHSACVAPSASATNVGVSSDDQLEIINLHNAARRAVNPTAINMQKLSWDAEIANTAQRWASHCVWGHDTSYQRYDFGRFTVGQNLALGQTNWTLAVNAWKSEETAFTYGGDNTLGDVGHYTQMVWATTVKIGCGFADCPAGRYYACNYAPAGNLDFNNPYPSGSSCASCSSSCDNKLCDCAGKVCLNGGTMNFDTCTCVCRNAEFYIQPYCALNCTAVDEPSFCTSWADSCESTSNVPQDCPDTCNWCPTAGNAGSGNTGDDNGDDNNDGGDNDSDDNNDTDNDGSSASMPSSFLLLIYGVGFFQTFLYLK